jgi:ADP-ribosyl-[dinitrogen reductase] hydrolase
MARQSYSKIQIKDGIRLSFGYNLDMDLAEVAEFNTFDETCQVTVPQALACFLQGDDFEDVLRYSVAIGGDSDTIAAMACSVAEAYYGGVPADLWDDVRARLPLEMVKVIDEFYTWI